ncbi:unnamed protein product [Paramecium octaurelia]|uniref:Uncharacterized protein n=1 Tax=Paramecium octaurelia TaxID=43137 RepID=A0A8S1WT51_PAROT|nr:unnamed protein product [Paramecium octaurelia]
MQMMKTQSGSQGSFYGINLLKQQIGARTISKKIKDTNLGSLNEIKNRIFCVNIHHKLQSLENSNGKFLDGNLQTGISGETLVSCALFTYE